MRLLDRMHDRVGCAAASRAGSDLSIMFVVDIRDQ